MPETPVPLVVRVYPHREDGDVFLEQNKWRFPGGRLEFDGVKFVGSSNEPSDIALFLNYSKYDKLVSARPGGIWRWDNEPVVEQKVVFGFDRIFTHEESIDQQKRVVASPVLDWWVKKSFDELSGMNAPRKTKLISAIASTRALIQGHIKRANFISLVEQEFPEIDVFGSGRRVQLEDKWAGLAPYRYSIAIENTSKADYWTEKVADCYLAYCVPIYFGATNIDKYFPSESLISLPIDKPDHALGIIRDTLQNDSWEWRIPYLEEARERVLTKFSFVAQVAHQAEQYRAQLLSGPITERKLHGRRTKPHGWRRGIGLKGNILLQLKRFKARLVLR